MSSAFQDYVFKAGIGLLLVSAVFRYYGMRDVAILTLGAATGIIALVCIGDFT